MILWQTIHLIYKHWLPNNHKTSALPPLRWVYGQASHFHIQDQQNSVLILGLIFFSLLPKEPTGNQFTWQIRYQTAHFFILVLHYHYPVSRQFHINQWFSSTQTKLKESGNINSGKKRSKYQNFNSDIFLIVYQFFIVFTATQIGGISLIIFLQLLNTLVYM